jgi:hypothetical protein
VVQTFQTRPLCRLPLRVRRVNPSLPRDRRVARTPPRSRSRVRRQCASPFSWPPWRSGCCLRSRAARTVPKRSRSNPALVRGYSSFSCMYGPNAFCKLLFRDVETVCTHVSGLPDGRSPKHARRLDEILAPHRRPDNLRSELLAMPPTSRRLHNLLRHLGLIHRTMDTILAFELYAIKMTSPGAYIRSADSGNAWRLRAVDIYRTSPASLIATRTVS